MKKFSEFLNESSWSRIIQHIENNDSFSVISAYCNENTDQENLVKHDELKNEIRSLGYGYIEQNSGYSYKDKGIDKPEIKQEKSLFIPKINYDGAMMIGKKYKQESILYKDKNRGFILVYCRDGKRNDGSSFKTGDIEATFKSEGGNNKITFNSDILKQAYSALIRANRNQRKGYEFIVESIEEAIIPSRTLSIAQKPNYIQWKSIIN
jgi:hypothetical protein